MLAAMFGGHALFTISDKTFDRMVEAPTTAAPASTSMSPKA